MITFKEVQRAYRNVDTDEYYAMFEFYLNQAFIEELFYISHGTYGEQISEAFSPILKEKWKMENDPALQEEIELILRSGNQPFSDGMERELDKLLQSDDEVANRFIDQLIVDFGLMQGINWASKEMVEEALTAGANPNAVLMYYGTRMTALVQAALKGSGEICSLLLRYGANPDSAQANGESALAIAANNGSTEICKMLLEAGANPNKPTRYGSPLALAENLQIAEELVRHGADVNFPDRDGDLPIIGFIDQNDYEGVEFLKRSGTDLSHRNNRGVSVIEYARRRGNQRILSILED